ncbi:unnamed protein product [Calypogeia fissa]
MAAGAVCARRLCGRKFQRFVEERFSSILRYEICKGFSSSVERVGPQLTRALNHLEESSMANSLRGFSNEVITKAAGISSSVPKREAWAERIASVPAAWASKDTTGSYKSSVDPAETARFAAVAETWWDNEGPYKALHAINPTRLSFIRAALCKHFSKDPMTARPLEGLRILDVGCGGGLACEPLARMGGHLMGIDAVEKNIRVAAAHAEKDPMTSSIEYRYTTAEQLVEDKETFDVVLALEIIEHVPDPKEFCKSLASLAKKDGMVVISTVNRSITAYGLAIVAAEYVLGWVPKGTHDWFKFLTPEELALVMNEASIPMDEVAGMVYNPLARRWSLSDDTNVNYIAFGIRHSQ